MPETRLVAITRYILATDDTGRPYWSHRFDFNAAPSYDELVEKIAKHMCGGSEWVSKPWREDARCLISDVFGIEPPEVDTT